MYQLTRFVALAPYVLIFHLFSLSPAQARPGDEVPLAPLTHDFMVSESYTAQQGRIHEAWAKARLGDRTAQIDPLKSIGMSDYDAIFYDLDLDLSPSAQVLAGIVRMEARVTGSIISSLEMHLKSSSLTVSGVTSGGQNVAFTHANDLLDITLDRSYSLGEMVAVEVTYSGDPSGDYYGWDTFDGDPLIWTLSEPYGARHWWPCKDLNTDKADSVNIRVTVDEDLVVASNGTLVAVNIPAPGKKQYVWQERYPIATYLVSMAIHPYAFFSNQYIPAQGEPMDVVYYVIPSYLAEAQAAYPEVVDMIGAFAAAFGEYPFIEEKYGHAHFPWGGGMEHQTCTSLHYQGYSPHLIAHELAHQWFGDMITCSDFGHIWLNEGFATWCEAYWLEASSGMEAYHAEMAQASYFGGGTIFVENPNNFYEIFDYYLSYQKASWVPHMLRHVMGDDDFFAGLLAYRQAFEYGSATTEEFRDVMALVAGINLDQFFQQWIYEDYFPRYRYSWNTADVAGGTRVSVYVEQVQSLGPIFQMPMDIRIETSLGQETFVVQSTVDRQWFTFHVSGEVTEVVLDPDNWILCTKELDQGTSGVGDVAKVQTGILANSPNPFNPRTVISFSLENEGAVHLDICDLRGRRIKNLFAGHQTAGTHELSWDGRSETGGRVASGTYFVVLRAGDKTSQHKITLVQ